ncbi:MAG: AsmA-like C-terminal domain-containing protein [Pirellulales bacterium]|nr:AsmA-like C-terminal domain-containing protein [Pirellulales bacterium]
MVKDLINFFWFLFKWGIVPGTIVALGAVLYLGPRVDQEIRRQVEARIASHYPGLKVTVRSAFRVEGKGIEIRDLSIYDPRPTGDQEALLHVEQIIIDCKTDLIDLVDDGVCASHVTIRRPTLRLTRLADGAWQGRQLWPPPKFSDLPPNATIEQGAVEVVDLSKSPPSTMTFRDVNLSAENQPRADGAPPGPPIRVIRGTLIGDGLGRVDIEAQCDTEQLDWRLAGAAHDLEISPELRGALPRPLAESLAALAGFRGRARLQFQAQSDPAAARGCRFAATGQVTQGRLDDARLPYPWTNIRATVHVNNEGLAVEDLHAAGGRSTLWISRGWVGFASPAPWFVQANLTQFTLDQRLRDLLGETMRATWDKFRPAGEIDLAAELHATGDLLDWTRSKLSVDCRDVAFVYHKFPYPMEHARGRQALVLENNELAINLVAHGGDRPVSLSGRIRQPATAPHGWFEASGRDMPFGPRNQRLLAALNEPTRRVFESLAPSGLCDFWIRVGRDDPGHEFSREIVLDVKDGAICFKHFPYPLEKIHGRIERLNDGAWLLGGRTGRRADGTWILGDLIGANDAAEVRGNGRLTDGPEGKRLVLALAGKNVLLDEDLHSALKPSMRQAWDNVDPQGTIDLETNLQWSVDSKKLDLVVVARPQPGTASIKPRMFPYHMEQLAGTLVYRDGHVTLDGFRATHGRTTISGRGHWNFLPDGSWNFHMEDLSVDRLELDHRDLVQAMPARLREGLAQLNPRGNLYLHKSTFDAHHSPADGQPLRTAWDLRLGLQPGRIECGICLENLRGELSLRGECNGPSFYSRGEIDLESMTFRNLQFTEVRGPLWVDDGRMLLGSWVGKRRQNADGSPIEPPRAITAKLFGGEVKTDAWVAPRRTPCYALTAEVLGADLAQFATETLAGRQDLKGRVGLRLNLEGRNRSINGLRGGGQMWLRDGDVYKLPVMIAVLKILSMREPDATAFSDADLEFQIAGDHIYLSPIEFNGDAISLVGQGQMDFNWNVDLALSARLGRNKWQLPIITPLMGEASRQTMTINVRGPLQKPDASRDVLPGVKEALRELEANLKASPSSEAAPWTATGRAY